MQQNLKRFQQQKKEVMDLCETTESQIGRMESEIEETAAQNEELKRELKEQQEVLR